MGLSEMCGDTVTVRPAVSKQEKNRRNAAEEAACAASSAALSLKAVKGLAENVLHGRHVFGRFFNCCI
ncbi:MAG: hypothetical protein Q4C72_04140 [Eubacteriales bacterium]|nr:hypothetical protein [Eubacteriales bacterium]